MLVVELDGDDVLAGFDNLVVDVAVAVLVIVKGELGFGGTLHCNTEQHQLAGLVQDVPQRSRPGLSRVNVERLRMDSLATNQSQSAGSHLVCSGIAEGTDGECEWASCR